MSDLIEAPPLAVAPFAGLSGPGPWPQASLRDLCARVRWTDVIATAPIPALFEETPDLPDRIRGGLGRALERRAAADRLRPGLASAASAWDLLFSPRQPGEASMLGRPYLVRADRRPDSLQVTVRLIGLAGSLGGEIAEGLAEAMQGGIALRTRGACRVSLAPAEVRVERRRGLALSATPQAARLRWRTPLSLRSGRALHGRTDTLKAAFLRRAGIVARWQGWALAGSCVGEVERPWQVGVTDTRMTGWPRNSTTPASRDLCLRGLVGDICIERPTEADWALMGLGEVFHVGGMTALGLGRMERHRV